ncbi:hypothetical protein GALMADRAFT_237585 [Galerina marginata CBS 339.88]|uniref:Uncharacterized protein n=1 Tax=Galerina marginata (strain CBS 339.88) TaxID=685588 RepID=A0A067TGI5_GALM3|nr:hypothetical protein GALMADRAFT_237585 [Galerina marginata CBS 339.88]
MAAYQLTEEDLYLSDDDPPCIRAARNPNPAVLSAILAEGARLATQLPADTLPAKRLSILRPFSANTYIRGSIHGIYTSPLIEAVKAALPENVEILIRQGVDANGILLSDLDEYSVRFIRGRDPKYNTYNYVMCPPRSKVMTTELVIQPQISPLTTSEIAARRKTFSRFWTEPELPTSSFRSGPARTALEVAASTGNIPVFDQVRAANSDESWWTSREIPSQMADVLTHSALSVSSPIHEAIVSGQQEMLQHLLSLGYSPNVLPLASPTCCFPPHTTAITFCNPPNLAAYDLLAGNPRTDLATRTPVFSIHVLHIAAARLDIPLIQYISKAPTIPLSIAGTTAVGHTLLHIASLPLTDNNINLFSHKIFKSIHDVRTLDTTWCRINLRRRKPENRGILHSRTDTTPLPAKFTPEDEADHKRQQEMVLWLLESGTQDLAARDVYGNTPLHYLASAIRVNEELIGILRAKEGGENTWIESKNEKGYSPADLLKDGKEVLVEQWKDFWMED